MTGKRRFSFTVAIVCLTALILTSCSQAEPKDQIPENSGTNVETQNVSGAEETSAQSSAEETVNDGAEETLEEATREEETMRVTEAATQAPAIRPGRPAAEETVQEPQGESLSFVPGDRIRVPYSVNKASVFYVTSASGVPAELSAETDVYDDSFFAEKALVVIEVSTSSGSTHPFIQSINQDGSDIAVTLYYEGTEIGTTDMATWLLWAEVDQGLEDCQWSLANAALQPGLEAR